MHHTTYLIINIRRTFDCSGHVDEPVLLILFMYMHGHPQGGQRGHLPPPLEFEKMTSYAAVLQNTPKLSLAPPALATNALYFSLKRRKKQTFSFASSTGRKVVDFLYGAPKTRQRFKVSVILPPSGKISAGAHGYSANMTRLQCCLRSNEAF